MLVMAVCDRSMPSMPQNAKAPLTPSEARLVPPPVKVTVYQGMKRRGGGGVRVWHGSGGGCRQRPTCCRVGVAYSGVRGSVTRIGVHCTLRLVQPLNALDPMLAMLLLKVIEVSARQS
jgi:hypothetical protein